MEAILLITTYPNKSRELKYLINEILKKGLAKDVKKINYTKSYYLEEGKVKKRQEEIVIITSTQDKKQKLESVIKAKHPTKTPQIICIEPKDIEENYLSRIIGK